MTIKQSVLLLVLGGFLVGACVSTSGRRGGLTAAQLTVLPEGLMKDYVLFSKRCSRCHTLSRPLNASITSAQHWRAYVNRMRRNPSSGISPRDGESILRFLDYWRTNRSEVLDVREGDSI